MGCSARPVSRGDIFPDTGGIPPLGVFAEMTAARVNVTTSSLRWRSTTPSSSASAAICASGSTASNSARTSAPASSYLPPSCPHVRSRPRISAQAFDLAHLSAQSGHPCNLVSQQSGAAQIDHVHHPAITNLKQNHSAIVLDVRLLPTEAHLPFQHCAWHHHSQETHPRTAEMDLPTSTGGVEPTFQHQPNQAFPGGRRTVLSLRCLQLHMMREGPRSLARTPSFFSTSGGCSLPHSQNEVIRNIPSLIASHELRFSVSTIRCDTRDRDYNPSRSFGCLFCWQFLIW